MSAKSQELISRAAAVVAPIIQREAQEEANAGKLLDDKTVFGPAVDLSVFREKAPGQPIGMGSVPIPKLPPPAPKPRVGRATPLLPA